MVLRWHLSQRSRHCRKESWASVVEGSMTPSVRATRTSITAIDQARARRARQRWPPQRGSWRQTSLPLGPKLDSNEIQGYGTRSGEARDSECTGSFRSIPAGAKCPAGVDGGDCAGRAALDRGECGGGDRAPRRQRGTTAGQHGLLHPEEPRPKAKDPPQSKLGRLGARDRPRDQVPALPRGGIRRLRDF
ncbi:hypothetical protein BC827DRAFT_340108 [Russula dissimulans]|nr:hypothetical protein BC827DRAFT_340108 [Russula dissimulans]